MGENKRIAFIYPLNEQLTIHPCILSCLMSLARSGFYIDVFTIYKNNEMNNDFEDRINIYNVKGYYGKNAALFLFSTLRLIWCISCVILCKKIKYRWLVGVQIGGLVAATIISFIFRIPCVYFCLELYFLKELKRSTWKLGKNIEKIFSRLCKYIITQDKWRARLFAVENRVPLRNLIYLPNSIEGTYLRTGENYLRKQYGIDSNKKIILTMASSFFGYSQYDKILNESLSWPSDWLLIIHVGKRIMPEEIMIKIKNNKRIILSDRYIPYNILGDLYSSADAGLVLYENGNYPAGGINLTYIGFSSGQFNWFMRCGVPCITSEQPTFRWIFNKYKYGMLIESRKGITESIERILSDHMSYRTETLRLFYDHLNFTCYYKNFERHLLG